ncbi:MAG: GTP-binding protein [Candidatus Hermodarchaeota archaeon]
MEKTSDYLFKISVVGDSGIGKTAFIEKFIPEGYFKKGTRVAERIGVNFYEETIIIETDKGPKSCKIRIWDTGGHENYASIRPKFYRGAQGVMVFFDLANRESFLHLNDWIAEVRKSLRIDERRRKKKQLGGIPILLVGNKSELENFKVSPIELDQFIRKHNVYYIETSTVTKEGIFDSFYSITSLMLGVDVHSEYFLSKEIIYRPKLSPVAFTSSLPTLSPQDLSELSQKAIFQKLDILEKKLDQYQTKEGNLSKQIEIKEKELNLKEQELKLKKKQLQDKIASKNLNHAKKDVVIFVSYSTKDAELFKIKKIAESLTNYPKIQTALYWQEDMKDNIIKYMSDNLEKCDIMLLFCSPNALKSKAIEKEWTSADIMNKPIIPVFIKTDHIPTLLKSRLGVEFDTFSLEKTIDEIYNLILKKLEKRIVDIKNLKTDF